MQLPVLHDRESCCESSHLHPPGLLPVHYCSAVICDQEHWKRTAVPFQPHPLLPPARVRSAQDTLIYVSGLRSNKTGRRICFLWLCFWKAAFPNLYRQLCPVQSCRYPGKIRKHCVIFQQKVSQSTSDFRMPYLFSCSQLYRTGEVCRTFPFRVILHTCGSSESKKPHRSHRKAEYPKPPPAIFPDKRKPVPFYSAVGRGFF